MQPGGRNPIRRSKKIGLTQGGRVRDGMAWEKWSKYFTTSTWEQLGKESSGAKVIVENPSRNYFHPCSGEELHAVLDRMPSSYAQCISAIVMRRISKHDRAFGVDARAIWNCIVLNAFPRHLKFYWGVKSPEKCDRSHYAPWCDRWLQEDQQWILQWTADELKRYYLYHLFLHELGHLVDPRRGCRRHRESEEFAENFALEWARKLKVIE